MKTQASSKPERWTHSAEMRLISSVFTGGLIRTFAQDASKRSTWSSSRKKVRSVVETTSNTMSLLVTTGSRMEILASLRGMYLPSKKATLSLAMAATFSLVRPWLNVRAAGAERQVGTAVAPAGIWRQGKGRPDCFRGETRPMSTGSSRSFAVDPAGFGPAIGILAQRFGDRLSVARGIRSQHANITTWHPVEIPDAVVFPESTEEVAEAVRICADHRMPVIPFGVGTSLEGHVNAPFGGLSIDMGRMCNILAVHEEDMDCVVQAGVTRKQLNAHIRANGLFFPIDPGADATLGGMASTRASGTNAVRYGTMKDNVLALTVVLPDGSISRTGTRARKSSAGYDLTRLIIGSEGTLAVVTEITLKLSGIPEEISGGVCPFPSV